MASLKTVNDQDLAILLKEGNHSAYAELYQRYYHLLFVHAYKRLGDEDHAKDIIQELFTRIWEKRDSFYLKSSFSGYFFTTINNRIIDHFLKEGVKEKYISSFACFLEQEESKADHLVREKQLAAMIDNEIRQLPPKMREIFELSRRDHLSHKEIAKRLSLSEKTIDRQVSNALMRLKDKFLLIFIFF